MLKRDTSGISIVFRKNHRNDISITADRLFRATANYYHYEYFFDMIKYLFRKPIYPVICDIEGNVFAAKSDKSFAKGLSDISLDPEKTYDLVDSTAENWMFSPKHMMVSPLTFRKHWTKKEIIAAYNGRKNSSDDVKLYSEKSLSTKRFDKVFGDIVDLLLKHTAKTSAP